MNPVLILTHNCLELTKRCVESVWKQDVPVRAYVYDNGSTDGTRDWLSEQCDHDLLGFNASKNNDGVSAGWNVGLSFLFGHLNYDSVLCVNNDTIIPSWFFSSLSAYDVPFVTGVSAGSMEAIEEPQPKKELAPCPDFSAFLIRRNAWEKIGPFDEKLVHYCGDMDYHIRAHRAGIHLWNAGVNFYHERSSTLRLASDEDRRKIQIQADADRAVFKAKWGVGANDPEYANLFAQETFGINAK